MRPVNLLPERYRARKNTSSARGNGSYVVLGGLAALLLAVVMYVMSVNQVNSREGEAVSAENEAVAAESRAKELEPYGAFATVKTTRISSVKELAGARFDWERLARELGRVLPKKVWLQEFDGNSGAAAQTGTAQPSGGSSTGGASTAPTVKLSGCALTQSHVAATMVRLRQLNRAVDVRLTSSQKAEGGEDAVAAEGSQDGGSDCSKFFKFEVTVEFAPVAPTATGDKGQASVPASLGGGQ